MHFQFTNIVTTPACPHPSYSTPQSLPRKKPFKVQQRSQRIILRPQATMNRERKVTPSTPSIPQMSLNIPSGAKSPYPRVTNVIKEKYNGLNGFESHNRIASPDISSSGTLPCVIVPGEANTQKINVNTTKKKPVMQPANFGNFFQNRGDSSNGRLETRDTIDLNQLDANLINHTQLV